MGYKNTTQRVGDKFIDCLDRINRVRTERLGLKKYSMNEFTNLITKHTVWMEIVEDTINLNRGGIDGK